MKTTAEMAAEAGFDCGGGRWIAGPGVLARFVDLIRAQALGVAAVICEARQRDDTVNNHAAGCVRAIRAAKEAKP